MSDGLKSLGGLLRLFVAAAVVACIGLSPQAVTMETSGTKTAGAPSWPNSLLSRMEVLALLETLNSDLLSGHSATFTLDRWCASHNLASPPRITAERVGGAQKEPTVEQRQLLGVSAQEPVRYRRVRLHCGDRILSEADNWYVPGRLTPDMNRELDSTDIAFGRAVEPLHFHRQTLSARLLWSPLPQGWEMGQPLSGDAGGTIELPSALIEHKAVLRLRDGTPFSEVVETYGRDVLAFPCPTCPR